MPRTTKELTAIEIEKVKPGIKPKYLFDGKGLFLLVTPKGGKWWRFKYRYENKGKLLSLGTYPEISLARAREQREDARKLLASGVDPSVNRKAMRSAKDETRINSEEVIACDRDLNQKSEGSAGPADEASKKFSSKCDTPMMIGTDISDTPVPSDSHSNDPVSSHNIVRQISGEGRHSKMVVGVVISAVVLLCMLIGFWFYQTVTDKSLSPVRSKQNETKFIHEEAVRNFVTKWLASWKSGDMKTYRSCYASDFQSKGKNLDVWISHKNNVYKKSRNINITIDNLQISADENNATAVFTQHYRSSINKESGKKILELRKINNEWKIYREIM